MLAEGDSAYLPQSGFDAVYPWHMFKMMGKVASGDRPAFALDSIKAENDRMYPGTLSRCISPATMMRTVGTKQTLVFPRTCACTIRRVLANHGGQRSVCFTAARKNQFCGR